MDIVRTNRGLKSLFELTVKNVLWLILIYVELLAVALHDKLLGYIEKNCNHLNLVLDAINKNLWLAIATIVVVAIPLIYLLWFEFDIKKSSLRRLIVFAITSVLFFCFVNEENHLPCGQVIALTFAVYSVGLCVLEAVKFMWEDERAEPQRPDYEIKDLSGFSVISDTSRMKDVGWDRFADIMVGKLFHTDISKEAFAVGINGEWGSGKTTFLNEIRKRIKGHAYVIDFFPWLSNSPAQIVKDYFARIKEIFDNKDTSSNIIDDYVDLIIDMDVDSSLTKMAKLVKHRNSLSLEYARKKVENCIPQDMPVIVVIDDLDRLEKDEIYEVLRLIRNTAKFKNVIYIVAYDKEYICGTLGMKGITAPREYLMKIFQAEIMLPVFEDSKLVELLIEELAIQLGDNDKGKLEIERMLMVNNQTSLPLSAFLRNFRDIKRFANLIALDIIHIEQGRNVYDIHVRDLFLLELIHYRYDSIYKLLLDDRGKLIKWDKDKGLYKCKDDAELPDDVKDDECLKSLLRLLFGSDFTIKPDKRSIRFNYNYISYFSLRPMVNQIGRTEFYSLLKSGDEQKIKDQIKIWLESGSGKLKSLFIRLKEVSPETMNNQITDSYLTALFSWPEQKEDTNSLKFLPYICMSVFQLSHFKQKKDRKSVWHDKLVERFKKLMEQERYLNVAAMLRGLHSNAIGSDSETGDTYYDDYYILEPGEDCDLMDECLKKLAEKYHPTDDDIMDMNSMLSIFVRNATNLPTEDMAEGRSLLCHKEFIRYFKSRAADNDIEKFYLHYYYDVDAEGRYAMPDEIKDSLMMKINKSFGSEHTYRRFLNECFILDDDQKKLRSKYLENYICPIPRKGR